MESEIDRIGIDVEGATSFSPIQLNGVVPEVIEVLYEGDTNELLNWSFQVFTGVSAGITVDLGPEALTTFTGENWYVDGERLDTVGQEAWSEPLGDAYQDVNAEFVGSWTSSLDLVLNLFEVCVDLAGWDPVDVDLPIPLASDDFEQFFPTTTLMFPLPVMGDLPARHDFGTIDVGSSAVLELPIENIGALDLEGLHSSRATPISPCILTTSSRSCADRRCGGLVHPRCRGRLRGDAGVAVERSVGASDRNPTARIGPVRDAGQQHRGGRHNGRKPGRQSVQVAGPAPDRPHPDGWLQLLNVRAERPTGLAFVLLGGIALLRRLSNGQV